jgi:nitrate/nitrite transport system substrate-binding protein
MKRSIRIKAHARGSDGIEKRRLRLGFVPLTDCAPLVFAKERGYFTRQGLDVELSREVSWASVRDKVAAGTLDAAQMLAPMTFSATLGLGGVAMPLCTGLSLDLNGNAVTVSRRLHERLLARDPAAFERRPRRADVLKALVDEDREAGRPPLRLGIVFPASSHDLLLRYWLAAAGIDPDRDLELRVVNPSSMVTRLDEGSLDGYCVGEPWNTLAHRVGVGFPLVTNHEIWNHSPEKVLGVSREWLDAHPHTHRAVLRALLEAGRDIDEADARLEVAHVIAGESFVGAPVDVVARSLTCGVPGGPEDAVDRSFHVFHRNAAAHPWKSHGLWILCQMLRWGFIEKPVQLRRLVDEVYRPDLHRQAAAEVGLPAPLVDEKPEGRHGCGWTLEEATAPIAMGPDLFFDGLRFDPDDVIAYLESFRISSMRVRMDELAELNGSRG